MRKLFFNIAHSSKNDAKKRLNALLSKEREEILQSNKTEKLIKEIKAVLLKYTKENAPQPTVKANLSGEKLTLNLTLSLKAR